MRTDYILFSQYAKSRYRAKEITLFPSEFELHFRQRELQRAAEHHRLVQSLRTEPTLWQRFRARLSARPAFSSQPLARRDVIALSR